MRSNSSAGCFLVLELERIDDLGLVIGKVFSGLNSFDSTSSTDAKLELPKAL